MNLKKILIISVFALVILSTVSMASAGLFDMGGKSLKQTTLNCTSNLNDAERDFQGIKVILTAADDKENLQNGTSKQIVYVNATDENGQTYNHTVIFKESENQFNKDVLIYRWDLPAGTYHVTAYYPGANGFNSSSFEGDVIVYVNGGPAKTSSSNTTTSDSSSSSEISNSSDEPIVHRQEVDIAVRDLVESPTPWYD
jgi:hypothetical protein